MSDSLPVILVLTNGKGALMKARCEECDCEIPRDYDGRLLAMINEHLAAWHAHSLADVLRDSDLISFRSIETEHLTNADVRAQRIADGRPLF